MDNTASLISKIKRHTDNLIVNELTKRGHSGLAPSHGDILATLIFNGELTKKEISLRIGRRQSTVTTLIQKLEKLGYVNTRINEEDGRSAIVFLSKQGLSMVDDFKMISKLIYETQYKGMSEEEIEVLRKGLTKMCKNFETY